MRALVAVGFDMTGLNQFGESNLEVVIRDLSVAQDAPKGEVVREVLRLGADARRPRSDGCGPLFAAVLDMDTEILRVLLDAGADPNLERMDTNFESLYDWAEFDYRYEVWNIDQYGEPAAADLVDEATWLSFLDRVALAGGKRRPDHLVLLRARGARRMSELGERPASSAQHAQQ